jgi:hypothetical protein
MMGIEHIGERERERERERGLGRERDSGGGERQQRGSFEKIAWVI